MHAKKAFLSQKKKSIPQLSAQLHPPSSKKNKDFRGGVIELVIEVHGAGGGIFLTSLKKQNPQSKKFCYIYDTSQGASRPERHSRLKIRRKSKTLFIYG